MCDCYARMDTAVAHGNHAFIASTSLALADTGRMAAECPFIQRLPVLPADLHCKLIVNITLTRRLCLSSQTDCRDLGVINNTFLHMPQGCGPYNHLWYSFTMSLTSLLWLYCGNYCDKIVEICGDLCCVMVSHGKSCAMQLQHMRAGRPLQRCKYLQAVYKAITALAWGKAANLPDVASIVAGLPVLFCRMLDAVMGLLL